MDNKVVFSLTSHQLADHLHLPVLGPALPIRTVSALTDMSDGSLCFSKDDASRLIDIAATVIGRPLDDSGKGAVIVSRNPRLDFARALQWIDSQDGFARSTDPPEIHATVRIGKGCVIAPGVKIGAGTIVHHNVVIGEGVVIGERCVIKSCTVIGEDGFGFERDEGGIPLRLVHLGGVAIGNDVEIGSLNTVCRGTLGKTIVEDHVKTDDHVHIAHNCHVRTAALLTACVELSGGVDIGEYAWVGPNSSVIQKAKIGARALVGIATNVRRDVQPGDTVAGNPARVLAKKD